MRTHVQGYPQYSKRSTRYSRNRVLQTGVFAIVKMCLGLMRKLVFRNH